MSIKIYHTEPTDYALLRIMDKCGNCPCYTGEPDCKQDGCVFRERKMKLERKTKKNE